MDWFKWDLLKRHDASPLFLCKPSLFWKSLPYTSPNPLASPAGSVPEPPVAKINQSASFANGHARLFQLCDWISNNIFNFQEDIWQNFFRQPRRLMHQPTAILLLQPTSQSWYDLSPFSLPRSSPISLNILHFPQTTDQAVSSTLITDEVVCARAWIGWGGSFNVTPSIPYNHL